MKNGFTLIELLAVVVILGILLIFVGPNIINFSNKSKQNLYEQKVKKIKSAAKEWGYDNIDKLPKNLTVGRLITEGYMRGDDDEKTNLLNPTNNESMNDCIINVTYPNNKVIVAFDTTNEGCSGIE